MEIYSDKLARLLSDTAGLVRQTMRDIARSLQKSGLSVPDQPVRIATLKEGSLSGPFYHSEWVEVDLSDGSLKKVRSVGEAEEDGDFEYDDRYSDLSDEECLRILPQLIEWTSKVFQPEQLSLTS